ncbi:MAG: DUF1460 domain-containing protein [Clostridium sp.]|nr:DUF1460 domain-containing protein [Prevotella sp.]MCM1429398.1 DUF1460 domain-containing protein [Clostridium sp.]MCM1475567.1 DUF1460 domain-containing protein [Muribaculaceae bacterium]
MNTITSIIRKKVAIAIILLSSLIATPPSVNAQTESQTAKIEQLMSLPGLSADNMRDNCAIIATALIGSGEDNYYHTDSIATLQPNLEGFNRISFIYTVVALGKASTASTKPGWHDFERALTEYACRRGEDNGFASLMWHASDWIGDNTYRGNVRELTEDFAGSIAKTKSLDYLTRHRDSFAALSDSAVYEKVRMTEMGFRTHKIPLLKKETITKKEITETLRDGDIIILNPQEDGIDIYEIGFITNREDGPHLIYYSPEEKQVVETKEPLARWMKVKTKHFNGYRIVRLKSEV